MIGVQYVLEGMGVRNGMKGAVRVKERTECRVYVAS